MDSMTTIPSPPPSVVPPPLSLLARLNYAARLWSFKFFVTAALGLFRTVKRGEVNSVKPTYTRRYQVRPMLENRVFIPKDWKAGTKLPLYIDIHGGGFALCDPQTGTDRESYYPTQNPMSSSSLPDDQFCHYFANEFNFCVVSIDYRKAPSCPFPFLVQDAAEVANAVLADDDLPVDLSKVALGGFSAGGNLSLAIAQGDGLRGKIGSLIPIYPVVDFSGTFKGSFKTTQDGKRDTLENIGHLFTWGYISQGQDRVDPLLSPIYAKRENLPPKIFMIGAEYDVLCHEAEVMALRLAGDGPNPAVGSGASWEREGIKWRKVLDVQHGFTHVKKKGQDEVQRKKQCEELYKEMADWLRGTIAS